MKTKDMTLAALFSAFIAVSAWITVPFTVPFTVQTFAVFLACLTLGGGKALISVVVYLLAGAVGLPVFSGFRGGVGVLFGPTGGYLVGFVALCLCFWMLTALLPNFKIKKPLALLSGLAVLYLFGTVWYVLLSLKAGGVGFLTAFSTCVLPFLLPDLIKMAVAFLVADRMKSFFKQ